MLDPRRSACDPSRPVAALHAMNCRRSKTMLQRLYLFSPIFVLVGALLDGYSPFRAGGLGIVAALVAGFLAQRFGGYDRRHDLPGRRGIVEARHGRCRAAACRTDGGRRPVRSRNAAADAAGAACPGNPGRAIVRRDTGTAVRLAPDRGGAEQRRAGQHPACRRLRLCRHNRGSRGPDRHRRSVLGGNPDDRRRQPAVGDVFRRRRRSDPGYGHADDGGLRDRRRGHRAGTGQDRRAGTRGPHVVFTSR